MAALFEMTVRADVSKSACSSRSGSAVRIQPRNSQSVGSLLVYHCLELAKVRGVAVLIGHVAQIASRPESKKPQSLANADLSERAVSLVECNDRDVSFSVVAKTHREFACFREPRDLRNGAPYV
jgi:hypothetical protein